MKKNITTFWFLTSIILLFAAVNANAQVSAIGTSKGTIFEGQRHSPAVNGLSQIYSATGKYFLSADGVGRIASSFSIRVNKPSAAATVSKAYFMGASQGFEGYVIPDACITLNGNPISWNASVPSGISSYNFYADVTSILAPIINPVGAGITNLSLTKCDSRIDGVALLVVFSDPSASERSIVIMFGALSTTGDNFSLTLGQPIDPAVPGALLNMGLGISFGAQGACFPQYSQVDINGQRLTTSAGGEDDGQLANGALITVGGIGDVNTNPPDPYGLAGCNPRYDDELYSLLPFITNTTSSILVNTVNPSMDDNVFLSYFEISGVAVIGEGVLLTQTSTSGPAGTNHLVTARVVNDIGDPVPGKLVTFTVVSGPNAGDNGSAPSDASGNVTFNYTGTGGSGTDEIQACISTPTGQICSNTLTFVWTPGPAMIPTMTEWGLIFLGLALLAFGTFYILKMRG